MTTMATKKEKNDQLVTPENQVSSFVSLHNVLSKTHNKVWQKYALTPQRVVPIVVPEVSNKS